MNFYRSFEIAAAVGRKTKVKTRFLTQHVFMVFFSTAIISYSILLKFFCSFVTWRSLNSYLIFLYSRIFYKCQAQVFQPLQHSAIWECKSYAICIIKTPLYYYQGQLVQWSWTLVAAIGIFFRVVIKNNYIKYNKVIT